jgi:hypothetical protein
LIWRRFPLRTYRRKRERKKEEKFIRSKSTKHKEKLVQPEDNKKTLTENLTKRKNKIYAKPINLLII